MSDPSDRPKCYCGNLCSRHKSGNYRDQCDTCRRVQPLLEPLSATIRDTWAVLDWIGVQSAGTLADTVKKMHEDAQADEDKANAHIYDAIKALDDAGIPDSGKKTIAQRITSLGGSRAEWRQKAEQRERRGQEARAQRDAAMARFDESVARSREWEADAGDESHRAQRAEAIQQTTAGELETCRANLAEMGDELDAMRKGRAYDDVETERAESLLDRSRAAVEAQGQAIEDLARRLRLSRYRLIASACLCAALVLLCGVLVAVLP